MSESGFNFDSIIYSDWFQISFSLEIKVKETFEEITECQCKWNTWRSVSAQFLYSLYSCVQPQITWTEQYDPNNELCRPEQMFPCESQYYLSLLFLGICSDANIPIWPSSSTWCRETTTMTTWAHPIEYWIVVIPATYYLLEIWIIYATEKSPPHYHMRESTYLWLRCLIDIHVGRQGIVVHSWEARDEKTNNRQHEHWMLNQRFRIFSSIVLRTILRIDFIINLFFSAQKSNKWII